jgi:hypothetical protein
MRKALEIGGLIAAVVLIAFGIGAIVLSINGHNTVNSTLQREQIVGTPDMTPAAIKAEAKQAGLPADLPYPTASVAGEKIDTGARARTFAGYMRIHTLEATGGLTYAQMGRYQALPTAAKKVTDGLGGTNDPKYAVADPKTEQPVDNARRSIWVTETALTTALNTSFMAEQLARFGLVVGVALLLSGIGFGILALAGALRSESSLAFHKKEPAESQVGKLAPQA